MTQTGYEQDFYAWLMEQAAHVRGKEWEALDIDNLAEELETLGREQRHAIRSQLRRTQPCVAHARLPLQPKIFHQCCICTDNASTM